MMVHSSERLLVFTAAALCMAWAMPSYSQTVELVACAASDYRWRDIATNLYSISYQDEYTYHDAAVTITFDVCLDSTYAGHLTAVNLKPNFAYQMKLVGKPEGVWGANGDDEANERIGYAGRWWRVTPSPGNCSDSEYEAHKDDPDYIFEGYLVFDFFITDSLGTADFDFASESSYHVLWWQHQRNRHTCDSPIKWGNVVGHCSDPAYDEDVGPVSVGVYGEIERLCYGETVLPDGVYDCRFALTEESFHQSGFGEGNWATVLVCDTLFFTIDCQAAAQRPTAEQPVMLRPVCPNPFSDQATFEFGLAGHGPVRFALYDVRGRLVRCLTAESDFGSEQRFTWDGTDSRGHRVREGVYLYRIEAPGGPPVTGKIVFAKGG